MEDVLLTENQAAQTLALSPKTLQSWRWRRIGPPYLKISVAIRYRRRDLETWLDQRTVQPHDGAGTAGECPGA